MLLTDWEKTLETMGLTEEEKELTWQYPAPVAVGFHTARRKANGGRRIDKRRDS